MNRHPILIVIPNLGPGGAQRVFRDQLAFYSRHARVVGCVFNWQGSFESDNTSNIVSLNVGGGKSWPGKLLQFWRRIRALKKLKRDLAIRTTISHLEGADYINYFARSGDQRVAWIHGTKVFDGNISGFLGLVRKKLLMPMVYRRFDKIVTVSDGIREEMINTYGVAPGRVRTIYNGIDLGAISRDAGIRLPEQEKRIFEGCVTFITHCRLAKQKNLDGLISVYEGVHQSSKTRLVILGDGELAQSLVELSEGKGLKTFSHWRGDELDASYAVYFLGRRDNPFPYLVASSVFLMTSTWEGFPLSLCEAMACGLLVFASDCHTGPREIITPGLVGPAPVQRPVNVGLGCLMPMCETSEQIDLWIQTIKNIVLDSSISKLDKPKERIQLLDKLAIEHELLEVIS